MCGPSDSEKTLAGQQADFAQQLQSSFSQRFANQDAVLKQLNNTLSATIAAGPGQQGFTPQELAARNAAALDTTSANYANAARAVNGQLAGRGGDAGLQSGVDSQIQASIATQGAQQLSKEQQDITAENYGVGRERYNTALAGMNALSGQYNPQAFASLGNDANQTAYGEAYKNTEQSNQLWKDIGGFASSAIGAGVGALTGGASKIASSLPSMTDTSAIRNMSGLQDIEQYGGL